MTDLRSLARPLRSRAAYRKHSASKPYALPSEEPIGTYRELVAQQVRSAILDEDSVTQVLRRFYRAYLCPTCLKPTACEHRDRRADVRLILRGIA